MTQTTAVLVDGDNISARNASAILAIAMKHGAPALARVYLDAQRASDWHGVTGFRLIHAGSGKNASDLLLTVEAMDFVHANRVKTFLLATSDGDFTHLALRLRELGATVIGVGEAKAPRAFRASCSSFVELGAKPVVTLVGVKPAEVSELDRTIRSVIASHSKSGTGMRISALSQHMFVVHGLKISSMPEGNWRKYLEARPRLFDLDPRGAEAMVRFRPEGFAAAA